MSWIFDEEVLAVLTAIAVVAATFGFSQIFYAGRIVEPFSELGLLGPAGKIGGYPKEVIAGSPFPLNIYVGNYEGKAAYYRILIKVGDKSSVINASLPLSAEPIMDIRAVLGHNTSRVIPINVTLYQPMVKARLVFEMWVYDEDSGTFIYHGRWNQLWVNVTEPATPISPEQHTRVLGLSPEIESKIADAYLAVRRAERAGGDISEIIVLLNAAIECAEQGDLSSAENLLNTVFMLEPKVAEAGVEAGRLRLYLTATGLAAAALICVSLYLYLRSNMWLLWAKAHWGWRVLWNSSGQRRLNESEKRVRDTAKSNSGGELALSELISGSKAISPDPRTAARELYKMVRNGLVRIVDPNPPREFISFFLSRYNAGFISASLMLALGVICIYFSESLNPVRLSMSSLTFNSAIQIIFSAFSTTIAFMRYALGSIMVLFLPGYSLVEALYPGEGDLSPLERLALSIGLSLAIIPLIGLILNYTPWGIRLSPIVAAITMLTVMLLLTSAYRKFTFMKLKTSTNTC